MSTRIETELHLPQHALVVTRTAIPGYTPTDDYCLVGASTPPGSALFQMTGVFAVFEPAMIPERVNSGRAKAQGKIGGDRRSTRARKRRILVDLRAGNAGIIKFVAAHGVGVGTVQWKRRILDRQPLAQILQADMRQMREQNGTVWRAMVGARSFCTFFATYSFPVTATPKAAIRNVRFTCAP
jgi:hypothetical protein